MQDDRSNKAQLSRRGLVAGATAGSVALASSPASAQRCPATPQVRAKGPPVWLDLDQEDLDDAYDQAVYAFNAQNIAERLAARSEKALSVIGKPEQVAYGPTDIEKVDIYKTKRPDAPTMIFIHGGAWRGGRSADFAVYAEVFVKAGSNFVAVDFNNVLEFRVTFSQWSTNAAAPLRGSIATQLASAPIRTKPICAVARQVVTSPDAW